MSQTQRERTRPLQQGSGSGSHTVSPSSVHERPGPNRSGPYDTWYPAAKGRGQFTREAALDRWPLARRVYEELERTGPASPARLAKRLGIEPIWVENALWWLTFADDNGAEQFVHGHVAAWKGGGRRTVLRFVHRVDLAHGCKITEVVIGKWQQHMAATHGRRCVR